MSHTEAPVALTVDVEFGRGQLERDVEWLLELFHRFRVRGTFFILGEVFRSRSPLITRIAAAGHEVGFHGEEHRFLHESTPSLFAAELNRCIPELEDLAQSPVLGYRAPYFSLTKKTAWALDVLAEAGIKYDASIFPGWHDRYGWVDGPRVPSRLSSNGLVVYPVPVLSPLLPIGFSGGGYLRILPWPLIRWGFARHQQLGRSGMIYVHPWEISPEPPRSSGTPLRTRINNVLGWRRMGVRLEHLLEATHHRCMSMAKVIESIPTLPAWPAALATTRHSPHIKPTVEL